MPLRARLRRRVRSLLRRAVEPIVVEQVGAAKEAAALRAEIEALDRRIDQVTGRMHDLLERLEEK